MGGREEILQLCAALSIGYHKGLTVMSAKCLRRSVRIPSCHKVEF